MAVLAVTAQAMYYGNMYLFKKPYHTSVLSGQKWVKELLGCLRWAHGCEVCKVAVVKWDITCDTGQEAMVEHRRVHLMLVYPRL